MLRIFRMKCSHVFLALLLWSLLTQAASSEEAMPPVWNNVSHVFEKRCINCHSKHGAAKALRLDSYEGVMAGSEDGAVVLPGHASQSELIRRLQGESTPRMPFLSTPLPDEEIDLIMRWIDAGLPNSLITP